MFGNRPLVDPCGTRGILYRDTGGIKDCNFFPVGATLPAPDDKVTELGVDISGRDQSSVERVVEITHHHALGDARLRQSLSRPTVREPTRSCAGCQRQSLQRMSPAKPRLSQERRLCASCWSR